MMGTKLTYPINHNNKSRYETYLIPGETLISGEGGKGEAFHPGIGYASTLPSPSSSFSGEIFGNTP